jgi:hypothetical protein
MSVPEVTESDSLDTTAVVDLTVTQDVIFASSAVALN